MVVGATVSGSLPWNVSVTGGRPPDAPPDVPSTWASPPVSPSRCGAFIGSSLGAVTLALTLGGQCRGRSGSVPCVTDMTWLDATAQADLVRRGEVSPKELVEAAIARIEAVNPKLDAVIRTRFDAARRDADGDLPDGPFRGVPTLFKDLGCMVAGEPTAFGVGPLRDLAWPVTSYLAEQFRA